MNPLFGTNVNAARAYNGNVNTPRAFGLNPLEWAIGSGRTDMVRVLIEKGANVNKRSLFGNGTTPLMSAAIHGHVKIAKLLVEAGARVDLRDRHHGYTALVLAVNNNHPHVARYLIQHGADVTNLRNLHTNLARNLTNFVTFRRGSLPRSLMNRETGRRNNSRRRVG